MTDERTIEARIYERLSKVIDPELGRSVTDLGMIAAIDAIPVEGKANTYEVRVEVELTVEGCPLSQTITNQINGAVSSYPEATLLPRIEVGSMSQDKLTQLVAGLKAERKQNPFNKPGIKTRIFAIASGKRRRPQVFRHCESCCHICRIGVRHGRHRRRHLWFLTAATVRRAYATHQSERHAHASHRMGCEIDFHRHVCRRRSCDPLERPAIAAFS